MQVCESYKNKYSEERCSSKCLKNLRFCGKHSKMKNPRIWILPSKHYESSILIQKIWKGYRIRNLLKLAGPGVLSRKICHNDEELVSMEEKNKQDPFDYFAFEESSKIWWFSIKSLVTWMNESPTNPYTKQPLSFETRKRLRELYDLNFLKGSIRIQTDVHTKAIILSQIMEENGFSDVNYTIVEYMPRLSLISFTDSLKTRLEIKLNNNKHILLKLIQCCANQQYNFYANYDFLIFQIESIILYILRSTKEKFDICFIILGALYDM